MRNLLPPFIQDQYLRGNQQGQFTALGLFIDLSGFTGMAEALMQQGRPGAEALAAMMHSIFGPLIELVYQHGGFVARTAGDAFTALFPQAPGSLEDAPQRALAAAWRMQLAIQADELRRTPFGEFSVRAKIGLAHGEVSWGIVSAPDEQHAVYYFQGSAVEECAAAEHAAQPGEIILQPALLPILASLVEIEPRLAYFRLLQVRGRLPELQPVTPPLADPQALRAFFPASLIDQPHAGEFRQIVSLFISLPTVRNAAQLSAFMGTVFKLQDRYGGLLSTLDFGDKGSNLLLFWGAPLTLENDVERALNFILDLQALTSIPINAGVTYHLAHAGFLGSPFQDEYNCYGRGIALASRLMAAAPRGEIWVAEKVQQQAQAHFEFEPAGELAFKGFAAPQPVYILLDRKSQPAAFYQGRLVGRQAELARLAEWVAPLWQAKSPGFLVVWGEAGMGKSRLVHEFLSSALFAEHPALWAVCQTSEILRQPFGPLSHWLRGYLDQSEGQVERLNKRNFNRKLDDLIATLAGENAELADEIDRTRSFLGALVDLHWPDSLYEQMDPQGRYQNTWLGLIALLQAESLRQPVILFLEDIQWLDVDTRHFLPRLQRAVAGDQSRAYPVGLIATARQEETNWLLIEGVAYQELALTGMALELVASLAQEVLGQAVAPGLVELLAERAGGNPLFAENILAYLQEQGWLAWNGSAWEIAGELAQFSLKGTAALPADIGGVLVARLDRLAQDVREVVQTAAVLGREFDLRLLRRMLAADPDLERKITAASQAAIWSELPDGHYLFHHTLLREAAYWMQVSSQRCRLHARAVQAMEALYSEELPGHAAGLAFHSEQAELIEKACLYYRMAGDEARQDYQNEQSFEYYSRALSLLPEASPAERFSLLVDQCRLLRLIGDQARLAHNLTLLEPLAVFLDAGQLGGHQAQVLSLRAMSYLDQADYPNGIETARQVALIAQKVNSPALQVRALVDQSFGLLQLGRHAEALEQALLGLEIAGRADDDEYVRLSRNQIGLVHQQSGDFATARVDFEICLEIARQMGDLRGQAQALTNLAGVLTNTGSFSLAQEYFHEALRLVHVIGDRVKEGVVLMNLGFIAMLLGDYQTARADIERTLHIARQLGDSENETFALINLSAIAGRLGDHPAALTYAGQALELSRRIGDPSAEAWALTYQGHAGLEVGELSMARESYLGALEIRQRLSQPNLACEPLAGLARWALQGGDIKTAESYANAILAHLDGGGTLEGADEPLRVYLSCVETLLAGGRQRAREILRTAYALLQEQASGISDAELRRSFLEDIPCHQEIRQLWET